MDQSSNMTVLELRNQLEKITRKSSRLLKMKYSTGKFRNKILESATKKSWTRIVVSAVFRDVILSLLLLAAAYGVSKYLISNQPAVARTYLYMAVASLFAVVAFARLLKHMAFFSRYRFGFMKYMGEFKGEYPYYFIKSIADGTKTGFSYVSFKMIDRKLKPDDIVCVCQNNKTNGTEAIIYLAQNEKSGVHSYRNDFSHTYYLPGISRGEEPLVREFSRMATLFNLNSEAVNRGRQLGSTENDEEPIKTETPIPAASTVKGDNNENKIPAKGAAVKKSKEDKKSLSAGTEKGTSADKENRDPFEELNRQIGLREVKEKLTELKMNLEANAMRREAGIKIETQTMHFVFTGNPGTGKTTIGRILSRFLKDAGLIERAELVEVSRHDLVAEYVGQTAIKVDKVIDGAMGGVLFIDEAYALATGSGSGHDYGREAIDHLLKRMEDDRDRLVVVVAGYKKEMQTFLDSNSGLRSRFTFFIEFPDYSAGELRDIFIKFATNSRYVIDEGVSKALLAKFEKALKEWPSDKPFENARFARNYYEECVRRQGIRILEMKDADKEDIVRLTVEDLD
jgi:hypothetical protein